MLDIIKSKIWEILNEKEVSLVMIFDRQGRILWHRGRKIVGKTIGEGDGFSKSYIKKSLNSEEVIDRENVIITSSPDLLPESAFRLVIKGILIHPIEEDLFLYIDSGKKETFNPCERDMFKMLGDILAQSIKNLKKHQEDCGGISGRSKAIEKVKKMILNYSIVEEPILLKGETGVGKNHIAEQIHRYSGRHGKFVVVHTPSINENLFDSEIFGHRKGAFTDAKFDQKGLVAEAQGGTLFFDEISEIPLSFQTKLLRFIETKKYRILGETCEKEADVRIVTATNKDLLKAINEGEFREDLYFRLHVLEIEIPPLRQRKEDIRPLVLENKKYLNGRSLGDGFWEVIFNYNWPGNVRELITVLKRAGITVDDPINGEDIQTIIDQGIYKNFFQEETDKLELTWKGIKAGKSFWEIVWQEFIHREVDRCFVKQLLKKAYIISSNNFKKMIEVLNMEERDYQKFMSLMYKYRIDPRN